jgi:hypothetical protein
MQLALTDEMRCRATVRLIALMVCVALLGTAPAARAQPDDATLRQARDKFRQAISLQTGGDWGGALSLLREVAAVKATPQVRFNMALCEENLGQLVAARGSYELAVAEADGDDSAESVVTEARQRLESLDSRIPKVVIERGEGADLARVSLDGVVVGASLSGKPLPVDPGQHVVEATASGFSTFRESFRVAEKDEKFVRVTLTPQTQEAEQSQGVAALPDEGPPAATQRRSFWPWIVGGAGVASLAASAAFFLLRADTVSELDAQCGAERDRCPPSAGATIDRGETYTTLANVTLIGGIVLAGTAATWWIVDTPSGRAVGVAPAAQHATAGATFVGRF